MDYEPLLIVHEQDAVKRPVVGQVRAMLATIGGIADMPYERDHKKKLTANAEDNAAKASADDVLARQAKAASDDGDALELRDDAERERLESMNGHSVDPRTFTSATTAGEISSLLRDAEAVDPDTLRRAWGFALPVLRQMAAREQREYKLPHAASAFNIWTTWQSRMASATRHAPTREVMSDRAARRQREIRDKALEVWRVVGRDDMVARHLRAADLAERIPPNGGEPAKGSLVVGRWFDLLPNRK